MLNLNNFTNQFLLDGLIELDKKEFWMANSNCKFKYYEDFKEFLNYHKLTLNHLKKILLFYKENNKFSTCPICNKEHFYFHQQILRECCCKEHQKKYGYSGAKDRRSIFLDLSKSYSIDELKYIYSLCSIRGMREFYKELNLKDSSYLIKLIQDNQLVTSQLKIILDYYFKNNSWPKCEICGKEHVYIRRKKLYNFCSSKCGDFYAPKLQALKYKEKTGYDHHMKNPEFIEKYEKLNIERTGYSFGYKNPKVQEKIVISAYKSYLYVLNNKEYKIQGYEKQCLDHLINIEKIKEDDIILLLDNGKPIITYVIDNKEHYYFPDIYIKSQNRIIEVKSTYTFKCSKEINLIKLQASKDAGYNANIYIMHGNGLLLEII